MKIIFTVTILFFICLQAAAQYHFEQFKKPQQQVYKKWKTILKNDGYHFRLAVPDFFDANETLIIDFTPDPKVSTNSIVRVYRKKRLVHKTTEPTWSTSLDFPGRILYVADINGDGKKDLKLKFSYHGCGIAAMTHRVIYLFQNADSSFTKISYDDKFGEEERTERDFDNDGNYEIITMNLVTVNEHNYWCFNLFNFTGTGFTNVNEKAGYPIMVQYLFRRNYAATNKIQKKKMKQFELYLPDNYVKK